MIVYLYGPDSYRRGRKLREIIAEYKKRYTTHDLLHIDLSEEPEDGWVRAKDFLNQPSMFVESKVLVLKEAAREEHAGEAETIKREITSEKTFIVISDSDAPHPEFSFLLKRSFQVHEFRLPNEGSFEKFLLGEARARGLSFEDPARRHFVDFIRASFPPDEPKKNISFAGERMWRTVTELEKLALVNRGEVISRSFIERYQQFLAQRNFYDLVRLLLSGRALEVRLGALEELFAGNADSARTFNTLCYMAGGKDALFLAEADVGVKSGKLDYETALLKTALRSG